MKSIAEVIEWIERVRDLDPSCEALLDFQKKRRMDGKQDITSFETQLFMPPNPSVCIQEFHNGMGSLYTNADHGALVRKAKMIGLDQESNYTQGNYEVLLYKKEKDGTELYLSQKSKKARGYVTPREASFTQNDKTYKLEFNQAIWICGKTRGCHDFMQPFLELVDSENYPSAVVDRSSIAYATNVPLERWD